eukprot:s788_g17.t1
MFDFDEIEETVEKEGEWKEGASAESPSKAGGCGSLRLTFTSRSVSSTATSNSQHRARARAPQMVLLAPSFGVGALLLRQVKSETRTWLDFLLDASKQLFGCLLLWGMHCLWRPSDEVVRLSERAAEATCGVVFQYLLLQSLSRVLEISTGRTEPWFDPFGVVHNSSVQAGFVTLLSACRPEEEDFRTGEYRDDADLMVPGRYVCQLLVWLACVCASEWALETLSLPGLFRGPVVLLLDLTSWSSSLEGLTELLVPCVALALQFWLTDCFIQKGGLPPWQAFALVIWASASAVGSLLSALAATCRSLVRLWPSAGHGRLGEPLLDEEEGQGECQASEPKQEAPEAPELPKARGALLRAAVAEDAADFIKCPPVLPSIGSLPSPRAKKPWLPPSVTDLGPAKAPFQQFQNLSGMFAERDSELKELHEELDELLGGLGLDHLMQTPSPSPASPGSPEPVKPVNLNGISKKATKVWESPVVPTPAGVPAPVVPAPAPVGPDQSGPVARSLPCLATSSSHASRGLRDVEGKAEGPVLPVPHGPTGPTPRTDAMLGNMTELSLSEPGAAPPPLPQQATSTHRAPTVAEGGSDCTTSPSQRWERKSRRYDVLDRKIDSLLSALGTSSTQPTNAENGPSRPSQEERQSASSVDERIQRLQEKMQHLFLERAQGASGRGDAVQKVSEETKEEGDGDGMFDFDEIEADAARQAVTESAKGGGTVPVEVRFVLQGEKWSRSFEVPGGSSVNDLRREMAGEEAEWIQLYRFGRQVDPSEVLNKAARFDFAFRPPASVASKPPPLCPEAVSQKWKGHAEVRVHIDHVLHLSHRFPVKEGTTISELKAAMASSDPTSASRPEDFELCITGGPRKPLAGTVVLSEVGLWQLDLLPP